MVLQKSDFLQRACIRFVFAAIAALLLSQSLVRAQFTYTTNNGTLIITGYTGPGGDVIIPDTINGLAVSGIGSQAFYEDASLGAVTIGNNVKFVGGSAFANCVKLTSVSVPAGVTNIGNGAFYECSGLTNITFGTGLKSIGRFSFQRCTNLTKVIIPSSVTNIGESAFLDCGNLLELEVDPQNVFYSSLDGVLFNKSQTVMIQYPAKRTGSYEIPQTVTNLGAAFRHCQALTSVAIPGSVRFLEDYAFAGCIGLTNMLIPSWHYW